MAGVVKGLTKTIVNNFIIILLSVYCLIFIFKSRIENNLFHSFLYIHGTVSVFMHDIVLHYFFLISLMTVHFIFLLQILNENGEIKGWIDASETGSGNWMKYIRNCSRSENQNLMAIQIEEEVSSNFINDYNYVYS